MDRRIFFLGLIGFAGAATAARMAIGKAEALPWAKELKLPPLLSPVSPNDEFVDIAEDVSAGQHRDRERTIWSASRSVRAHSQP